MQLKNVHNVRLENTGQKEGKKHIINKFSKVSFLHKTKGNMLDCTKASVLIKYHCFIQFNVIASKLPWIIWTRLCRGLLIIPWRGKRKRWKSRHSTTYDHNFLNKPFQKHSSTLVWILIVVKVKWTMWQLTSFSFSCLITIYWSSLDSPKTRRDCSQWRNGHKAIKGGVGWAATQLNHTWWMQANVYEKSELNVVFLFSKSDFDWKFCVLLIYFFFFSKLHVFICRDLTA